MNTTNTNNPIKIVIADDHGVVITGMEAWLARCTGMLLAGKATDGRMLVTCIDRLQPDVVLMDIRMPNMDGFETAAVIQEQHPATALIAMTGDESPSMIAKLVMARFNGILLKGAEMEEIFEAIQHVYLGNTYYCRQTNVLLNLLSSKGLFNAKSGVIKKIFSNQEEKIFKLMKEGLTAPQIAERLGIKGRTVETYRERMYEKTGTKGVGALIKWGIENGY